MRPLSARRLVELRAALTPARLAAAAADPLAAPIAQALRDRADQLAHYRGRLTPVRAWSPMTDDQWHILRWMIERHGTAPLVPNAAPTTPAATDPNAPDLDPATDAQARTAAPAAVPAALLGAHALPSAAAPTSDQHAPARRRGRPMADPRDRLDAILRMAITGQPWHQLPPEHGKPDTVARTFRRWAHSRLWCKLLWLLGDPRCPAPLRELEYAIVRAARRAMRLMGSFAIHLARHLRLYSALPLPPWMLHDPILSESVRPHFLQALGNLTRAAGTALTEPESLRKAFARMEVVQDLMLLSAGARRWRRDLAPP